MAEFNRWLESIREISYLAELEAKDSISEFFNIDFTDQMYSLINLVKHKDFVYQLQTKLENDPQMKQFIQHLIKLKKFELITAKENSGCFYNFRLPLTSKAEEYIYYLKSLNILELFRTESIKPISDYIKNAKQKIEINYKIYKEEKTPFDTINSVLAKTIFSSYKNISLNKLSQLENKNYLTDSEEINEHSFNSILIDDDRLILIDCIFISFVGSKPIDDIVRVINMTKQLKRSDNYKYVLIIDGQGCQSMQTHLKKLFAINQNIFNLTDLENEILNTMLKITH